VTAGRVHKVLGTETEFGIAVAGLPGANPVAASGLLVNCYAGSSRVLWSWDEESPGRDARGLPHSLSCGVDPGTVNAVLANGARFYVDHAHPEYSTPECYDAMEGALHDKAGERVLACAVAAAQEVLPAGQRLVVYKNNSDGKGNSYGCHENYLVSRALPFGEIVRHLTGFLVTRQIFTGSGKVGSENGRPDIPYQISQRADFFEELVGLETTMRRPIVNTRDEPHADAGLYRRLHVIPGDANLSETQTFLKLGSAALLLAALESDGLPRCLLLEDPVEAMWQVSHDPTLRRTVRMQGGGSATALDLQWQYLEWCSAWAAAGGAGESYDGVLAVWNGVLSDLERDPLSTADRLDWTAKLSIIERYRDRDGLGWDHPLLHLVDLQYHDVNPARSLYHRLVSARRMQRLFTDQQVEKAASNPPERTRAYFRGRCVSRFPRELIAVNWDSLVFDTGEAALRRVPMMDPLRGGRERVADLLDQAGSAADLVRALGGEDGRTGAEAHPAR
jgi:proteasome accessory factor PafA2